MAKPVSIKIFCPLCKKITEIIILKRLNKDAHKEELNWFANNKANMIRPEMTKKTYDLLHNQFPAEETTDYVIGKIKEHKPTMLGKPCLASNRVNKILFYFFMEHEEQLGGFTFRIGEEIKHT